VASPVIFTRCVVSAAAHIRGLLGRFTMQRHGVGDVEGEHLGQELGAGGELGRRKPVLAREHVERCAQNIVSRSAAQAGVEAERGFLAHGFLAR
jgi:hypothetical protein